MYTMAVLRGFPPLCGLADAELQPLTGGRGKRRLGIGMITSDNAWLGHKLDTVESGKVCSSALCDSGEEIPVNIHRARDVSGGPLLDGLARPTGAVVPEKTVIHTPHRQYLLPQVQAIPRDVSGTRMSSRSTGRRPPSETGPAQSTCVVLNHRPAQTGRKPGPPRCAGTVEEA